MKVDGLQVNLLTEVSSDRIDALVRASRDYDYVVLEKRGIHVCVSGFSVIPR